MKQRVAKKGGRGKASTSTKKNDYRNKKSRNVKAQSHHDDDDLSDVEAEYLEDIPEAIAKQIHQLANENDRESRKVALANDAEFLEQDALISDTLKDISGFMPEKDVPNSSVEIGQLSKVLFKSASQEDEQLSKIRELYTSIGVYLSKFKSGNLPKAFKVLPNFENWEELVGLTCPENWTPNAMYLVTHIFASNMTDSKVEIFYNKILLPTIRKDIRNGKKLNYHLYMALKKAVFKPVAWFKGIIVPMVEEGCSYKEAAIIGNVLRRISIPVLHASAFILRLCQCQKWFGSSSFIMSILLQKGYNLPKKVVEECVRYFCKFEGFEDQLPVIWHQSLLTLVTSYKHYFSTEDYARIQKLIRVHAHAQITPVISHLLSCTVNEVEM
ncbi:bystin family protein, putative [Babesia bigemina]|uniref:Bystin family protein, putative n=1 Tax=Babesia bigemina TaxID=5866 RepID=A0A061D8G1_BABBI|nr:bystin family protein, putative [Babesia bigemina]CDR95204.1 bystin family protein, putative [Babesia bigemina]|eukprot:XP_012767390.1 bystin family protein, putative [Babesia bigemina]